MAEAYPKPSSTTTGHFYPTVGISENPRALIAHQLLINTVVPLSCRDANP